MTDKSSTPANGSADLPTSNIPEFSVSEISTRLKRSIEDMFGRVRVRGEISGFKRPASGHLYMALKDADAVLDAVCWRGAAGRLRFKPEDGLEVVCVGRLTTYPARSKYQMVIESMEPAGAGALMALLEERKRKLAAEGLFAPERKRAIPFIPGVIGVVTSPTGAVIRDILHRLGERFPRRVLVWPVLVQGEGAAEQVARAIRGFNALAPGGPVPRPDVLIVARGGGSIEDLWAFNEEVVVRAAAESDIPLISAVGHETDTTLIDFASDRRAPTPTAAAEIAVPVRSELQAKVESLQGRLTGGIGRLIEAERRALSGVVRGLRHPRELLEARVQRLDDLSERLARSLEAGNDRLRSRLDRVAAGLRPSALQQSIARGHERVADLSRSLDRDVVRLHRDRSQRLASAAKLLDSLAYTSVLRRGYAVVREAGAAPLTSAKAVRPGMALDIEFHDGHAAAVAGSGNHGGGRSGGQSDGQGGRAARKPAARPAKPRGEQGSLL